MRKVYVWTKVRLIISADDGIDIDDVLADMDYSFASQTEGAKIEEFEIMDRDIYDDPDTDNPEAQ